MSLPVFPTLKGTTWSRTRAPHWKTLIQETASGKEARVGLMSYPIWIWTLNFEYLPYTDFLSLLGLFNACQGSLSPFLFYDPYDYASNNQVIGVGDNLTTNFQLIRSFASFVEPVQAPKTWGITVNGNANNAYTMGNNTGIVSFNAAPAFGANIGWNGTYYWRCRFMEDAYDFEEWAYRLWELKKMQFRQDKV
jgi:uncharacterized protein (TIGR02217 family)